MDDEETVRRVAERMLNHIGIGRVCLATDGAEAIELYRDALAGGRPFDGVILDVTVPGGMGGKETMAKLLEIDPDVKAIVSSGYAADGTLADYSALGFKAMIAKPYTLKQLAEVISAIL
jgi:CheY-like chemotaxis protein